MRRSRASVTFSVAAIRHQEYEQLMEEGFISVCVSRGIESSCVVGKAGPGRRHGGSSRKLVKQVSVHIQEAGQKSRKWGETINPQSPPSMTYFL